MLPVTAKPLSRGCVDGLLVDCFKELAESGSTASLQIVPKTARRQGSAVACSESQSVKDSMTASFRF